MSARVTQGSKPQSVPKRARNTVKPTGESRLKQSKSPIDVLAVFDELPNSAHVRKPVVLALFACSASTLARRVADGRIPKPKLLSPRVAAWNVAELRRALQSS